MRLSSANELVYKTNIRSFIGISFLLLAVLFLLLGLLRYFFTGDVLTLALGIIVGFAIPLFIGFLWSAVGSYYSVKNFVSGGSVDFNVSLARFGELDGLRLRIERALSDGIYYSFNLSNRVSRWVALRPMSLKSMGEIIFVELDGSDGAQAIFKVKSRSSIQSTVFDFGVNEWNEQQIVQEIEK